eukprot:GHVR01121119.1.p2 GENE.GHVR01121119.1~~GHVR01121119.1.p2  ORF type:complete len:100 (+),score=8.75 GHVR01121119.1:320-619(+)
MAAILQLVCEAKEFEEFPPKQHERVPLRELATKQTMRWPVKCAISNCKLKSFVLIQSALGHVKMENAPWELATHQTNILKIAERVAMCLQEVMLQVCKS